jgi:hypothetical protein
MLGELLAALLGEDEELEPIPERRWGRGRRWQGWERRALLVLADQARADDPRHRPSARRFAAAIAETMPGEVAVRPRVDEPDPADPLERLRPTDQHTGRHAPRRRAGVALVGAGAAVVVVAALAIDRPGPARPEPSPLPPAEPAHLRTARPAADSVITADGRRYRVGEPGDHLLVDDWACRGEPTVAAFRPSTHEVFLFDRWATVDSLLVRASATVPGSVEMVSAHGEDGCPDLSLRTADGDLVAVALDALR